MDWSHFLRLFHPWDRWKGRPLQWIRGKELIFRMLCWLCWSKRNILSQKVISHLMALRISYQSVMIVHQSSYSPSFSRWWAIILAWRLNKRMVTLYYLNGIFDFGFSRFITHSLSKCYLNQKYMHSTWYQLKVGKVHQLFHLYFVLKNQ